MPLFYHWLAKYGYFALFSLLMLGIVGPAIPDELILLYAGYNVSQGRLGLTLTIFSATLGSSCGITLSFLIGLYVGLPTIHRYARSLHLTEDNLLTAKKWFDRWGKWTLLICYFVPGVRHVMAIIAGASGLSWRGFMIFAYTGSLIWSALFVLMGFFAAENTPKLAASLSPDLLWLSVLVVLLAGAISFLWYLRSRRSKIH